MKQLSEAILYGEVVVFLDHIGEKIEPILSEYTIEVVTVYPLQAIVHKT